MYTFVTVERRLRMELCNDQTDADKFRWFKSLLETRLAIRNWDSSSDS